jgi:hypothetical protein
VSEGIIGERELTDGTRRPVYEDKRGQYVEADGERVYGVWLWPAEDASDPPLIVVER